MNVVALRLTQVPLAAAFCFAVASCRNGDSEMRQFRGAIEKADRVVLYEGLPHQSSERELFEQEKAKKPTREFGGFLFYREPLKLSADHAKELTMIFAKAEIYRKFRGEKKCGGFHPDFALEWEYGSQRFLALICFGCDELRTRGPDGETRHDLGPSAELEKILSKYRKNRPLPTGADKGSLPEGIWIPKSDRKKE